MVDCGDSDDDVAADADTEADTSITERRTSHALKPIPLSHSFYKHSWPPNTHSISAHEHNLRRSPPLPHTDTQQERGTRRKGEKES